MFERYTENARRAVFFARFEASQYGSPLIESEHLLLGLMRDDEELVIRFLHSPDSIESIRKEIESRITIRERIPTSVEVPLSQQCKRILLFAAEEAERLGHKRIGTEHFLLGILREEKCLAAEILSGRGLRLSALREEVAHTKEGTKMSATAQAHQPSPELFFDVVGRSNDTAALKTAVELDVFTAIGEGNQTPAALAKRCQASERGMRILCDVLTIIGFLTKSNDQYSLTPDSAIFLDRRSRAYLGSVLGFLTMPLMRQAMDHLTEAVRKGGTALSGHGTLEPENPVWVEFARSMAPMMRMPAEGIAELLDAKAGKPWKVLDIAAGHGTYGITLARHNPNAQITALDWPNVLEVAKENAQQAGVAVRHRMLPGSAFDVDFGTGFDVVLLTAFLHHFDLATCEAFMRKVHSALVLGGRAVIMEFVPNEDRISPPPTAKFSLTMLATTPSVDAYTFSQYERMLRNAGFSAVSLHVLPGSPQQIVLGVK